MKATCVARQGGAGHEREHDLGGKSNRVKASDICTNFQVLCQSSSGSIIGFGDFHGAGFNLEKVTLFIRS